MPSTRTSNNDNSLAVDGQARIEEKLTSLYYEIVTNVEEIRNLYPLNIMPENEASRDNLLSYLILRQHNLEDLQMELAEEGLSSLGRLEGQVLISIERVLKHFKGQSYSDISCSNEISCGLKKITHQESRNITTKRSRLLLGRPRKGRSTRIMVTLDSESIHQPQLLEELLIHGMDLARINCAHDTPREWKMLIDSIRHAEERLVQRGQDIGRRCRVVMDLAGPKIRTGSTGLEIRPLKIGVPKDIHGRPVKLVEGFIDGEARFTEKISLTGVPPSFIISIKKGSEELPSIEVGERLSFYDTRGRYRTATVLERISPTRIKIGLDRTAYLQEDIALHREQRYETSDSNARTKKKNIINGTSNFIDQNRNSANPGIRGDIGNYDDDNDIDAGHGLLVIGALGPQSTDVQVRSGDTVLLHRHVTNLESGSPVNYAGDEKPVTGQISCNMPEVLKSVQVGHRVYIDDGKIGAIVRSATDDYFELEILSPSDTKAKIKPEKGLNFPDSKLSLPALTSEDIDNLGFIVNNATAAGLSFAHCPDDIRELHKALSKIGHPDFGILAKIETSDAIQNLARILLVGLDMPNFGILIARGDLAVEMGFESLPVIQEDILCMCEAAHIPVTLATQVLETMAKSGLPTRAEMIDAAMGQRAECVMLNKGRHVLEAVKTLSVILGSEERRHLKKRQIFGEFTRQSGFP
jgi:pyruvate kinase